MDDRCRASEDEIRNDESYLELDDMENKLLLAKKEKIIKNSAMAMSRFAEVLHDSDTFTDLLCIAAADPTHGSIVLSQLISSMCEAQAAEAPDNIQVLKSIFGIEITEDFVSECDIRVSEFIKTFERETRE